MERKEFSHVFFVNEHGCPVSDHLNTGRIRIRLHQDEGWNEVEISGDREGLLAWLEKSLKQRKLKLMGITRIWTKSNFRMLRFIQRAHGW